MSEHRDVLGHLEAAARELVAAGREALDAADEMLSDGIRRLNEALAAAPGGTERERRSPAVERIEVEVEKREPDGPGGLAGAGG